MRSFPDSNDEVELVGQLVKGWCAFAGASEAVWASMGPERDDVEVMRGSALEVSILRCTVLKISSLSCPLRNISCQCP